jgi:hypothetical protein
LFVFKQATIDSPVFGFYGGADARVNATIEDPNGEEANVAARNAAWERMKEILAEL